MKLGWVGYSPSRAVNRGKPPHDFFGHLIEVGDRYFYGIIHAAGVVSEVLDSTVQLRLDGELMLCSHPEKGICIDKVEPGVQ